MAALAQGTDFGGSVRVPAAFCGIVGIRPTPGLIPSYPAPLAWDPGQVHGPLARSAEDAALMLDAMIGLSSLSPISVAAPWTDALAQVERCDNGRGLRIAYASDIAATGVDPEIDSICRAAARALQQAGAMVEEIALDLSDGRAAYQAWRGAWMVGRQFSRLDHLEELGANLKGNVKAGLTVTALDLAAAEEKRQEVFHRLRKLFERYDVLLTPTAPVKPFPVEKNYPDEINGRKLDNYIDWIAGTYLITLVSLPAASVPAGLTADGLPVGLQVVAPRFEEPRILSVCKLIQAAQPLGWPPVA
jgi:amidase